MSGILSHLRPLTLIFLICGLSACVDAASQLATADIPGGGAECANATRRGDNCEFRNAPIRLLARPVTLPGRPYTFYPMAKELDFTDGERRRWTAPTGTLTDGASIPEVFVPVIGNPKTPKFANAAALHDAYCGIGNEAGAVWHAATWQQVHRMFYDSLVVSGTEPVKAKLMFSAVWLGGPRWDGVRSGTKFPYSGVPDPVMVAYMQQIQTHIINFNPPIGELIVYLRRIDAELLASLQTRSEPVQPRRGNLPGGPILGVTVP